MSERKAINKYYPPDYNPLEAEKLARKQAKYLKNAKVNKNVTSIRLMTPFSLICTKCNEFISKSKKFNGKKELLNERYLNNIKIFRLIIKCPRCSNEIAIKTDPKNSDYIMEYGARKNFDPAEKPQNDKIEQTKDETIDETLERLAKESREEKQNDQDKPVDKMEQLENRLSKLQKEQEDDEELERLRKENYSRMQRASTLRNNGNKLEKLTDIDDNNKLVLDDLDRIANNAFKEAETTSSLSSNSSLQPSGSTTMDSLNNADVKELISIRKSIKMKKKPLKSKLGIIIKKK